MSRHDTKGEQKDWSSSRLLFCGDPHGEFRHIVRIASECRPLAVILLGDLQPLRPLHEELAAIVDPVWFIHGNHDTDSEQDFAHVFDGDLAARNLHGRVVTLADGTRIAGLGGVFRESVWHPPMEAHFETREDHARATPRHDRWRDGPPRRHWSSIYPAEVDALGAVEADILVTHEAPSCHPHGFALIDDLARAMRVKTVFHGHHHDRLDYATQWPRLGFKAFGVGLCGISDRDGEVVRPGELDRVRRVRQRFINEGDDE